MKIKIIEKGDKSFPEIIEINNQWFWLKEIKNGIKEMKLLLIFCVIILYFLSQVSL